MSGPDVYAVDFLTENGRKDLIAQIKQLQASINLSLAQLFELDPESRLFVNKQLVSKAYDDCLVQINAGEWDNTFVGEGKYFKRDTKAAGDLNNPDRSYAAFLERNKDGKFNLRIFLDNKSKTTENIALEIQWKEGGFMRCKHCTDISTVEYKPTASLVDKKEKPKKETTDQQDADKSENVQNILALKHPQYFKEAHVIEENGRKRIYTAFADCDLLEALQVGIFDKDFPSAHGMELDRTIVNFNGLPIEKCKLDVMLQISEAMAMLEKEGISHNDIKPENILCTYDPKQKRMLISIADFDPKFYAEFKNTEASARGTYHYMPPEAFKEIYSKIKDHGYDVEDAVNYLKNDIHLHAMKVEPEYSGSLEHVPVDHVHGLDMTQNKFGQFYNVLEGRDGKSAANIAELDKKWAPNIALENYGGKRDIWSMGITFWNILRDGSFPNIRNEEDKNFLAFLATTPIGNMLEADWEKRLSAQNLYQQMQQLCAKALNKAPTDANGLFAVPMNIAQHEAAPPITRMRRYNSSKSSVQSEYQDTLDEFIQSIENTKPLEAFGILKKYIAANYPALNEHEFIKSTEKLLKQNNPAQTTKIILDLNDSLSDRYRTSSSSPATLPTSPASSPRPDSSSIQSPKISHDDWFQAKEEQLVKTLVLLALDPSKASSSLIEKGKHLIDELDIAHKANLHPFSPRGFSKR